MSGRKTILTGENEFFLARRAREKVGELVRDARQLWEQVRPQTRADVERLLGAAGQRRERADQVVSGLGEQVRRLEAETNRRLREQDERTAAALRGQADRTGDELDRRAAEQEKTWRAELTEARRETQRELDRLAAEVGRVTGERAGAAEAARSWLADAHAMHDLIDTTLPHDRHAPRELARLRARLATAEHDVSAGRPEAALGFLHAVYHDLSDLRVAVELAERDRAAAQAVAVQATAVFVALVERHAVREVTDEHGEPIPGVTLDVDFWSRGELTALRREAADAARAVRDDAGPMTTQQLRRVAERDVPEWEQRLAEVVHRAGLRQLASQIRVNVADVVTQSLYTDAGYELVDGTYGGEDYREAYYAKLRHRNGNEIVVDVAPAADDSGACVVELHSYDLDVTSAAERGERARALAAGLRDRGIETGTPEESGDADERIRDLEVVRRTAPPRDRGTAT